MGLTRELLSGENVFFFLWDWNAEYGLKDCSKKKKKERRKESS